VEAPNVPVRQQSYRMLAELTSLWPNKLQLQTQLQQTQIFSVAAVWSNPEVS